MKSTRLISSLALLTLLTACSKKDSSEHFADAQAFIDKQQYSAAVIELRSAVRQDPENYQFRLALGKALLKSGDIANAERELERALNYGAPHNEVAFDLTKAHYLAGNYPAVIALLTDSTELSARTSHLIDSFKALAEIELEDNPAAILRFEQLSQSDSADITAFAVAHLKLLAQQPQEALSQLLAIADDSELFAEALFLQSKIHMAANDNPAAITTLSRYLELTPTMHLARLFLAQAYVGNAQFAESEPHLDQLLKQFPEQPIANYLKSVVRFQSEDFTAAKEFSEKAVRQPSIARQARIIAALSSVRLGLDSQALSHLDSIKDQLQQLPEVNRLYAILQLRAGETEIASKILAQLPEQEQDLQLIATTAFELLRKGSVTSAEQLLKKYEERGELDAASLTALGTIKLGIEGQQDIGIENLEQALLLEPGQEQIRFILAANYLQRKEYDKAEKLADAWINDEKMQLTGYNLKAYSALLQQDWDSAKALTDNVLSLQPHDPFSTLLQASMNARNGRFDEARTQLQLSLDSNPTYLAGLEMLYSIERKLGNTEDSTQRIQQLHEKDPKVYLSRLLLARVLHDQQQYQESITLLKATPNEINGTNKPEHHWLILIDANQRLNNNDEANLLAKQWFELNPDKLSAGYTYANALTISQQNSEALQIINQLLAKNPGQPKLMLAQLTLLTSLQRFDQALALLNNLPEELTSRPDIALLAGKLRLRAGDLAGSLKALQNSYTKQPTTETAMLIGNNLARNASVQTALDFIQQHIDKFGSTAQLQTYMATLLLETDIAQSKAIYKKLLEQQPDNIVALNNYAWLLMEDNLAAEAEPYAANAIKLMPDNPDIIDTYGKVLLMLGKSEAALTHFERSLRLRPDNNDVLLNYAEALIATKQFAKAADTLSQIQSTESAIVARQAKLRQQVPTE